MKFEISDESLTAITGALFDRARALRHNADSMYHYIDQQARNKAYNDAWKLELIRTDLYAQVNAQLNR